MIPIIEKIVFKTTDKLYFKFNDGDIRQLDLAVIIKSIPDWQKEIVKNNWKSVKIKEGWLYFDESFALAGDTVKNISSGLEPDELYNIAKSKKISKKRIIQSLASLF